MTSFADHEQALDLPDTAPLWQAALGQAETYLGILDPAGRLLDANRAAAILVGHPREALIGRMFWETPWWTHDSAEQDKLRIAITRAAAGIASHFETSHLAADGSIRAVDFALHPVRGDSGMVESLLAEGRDITDWRQEERARLDFERRAVETEEKYGQLFATMLDGFALHEIILDSAGKPVDYRILEVNPAFERATGLRRDKVVGRTVKEVFPRTEDYWISVYGRVAITGEPIQVTQYAPELDKHFEVSAFSPAPGRFACLFIDVTERVRAEESLRDSKERYRGLIESQSDFVVRLDMDGRFAFVNGALAKMLGRPADEVIGRFWHEVSHPDDQAAIGAAIAQALQPPVYRATVEGRLLFPGGTCWVAWEGSGIRDTLGHLVEVQAVGRDVTEARRSRERLQDLVRSLDASNKELEQFAYVASHDLREPLRMVSSYVGLLERRLGNDLTDEIREFIGFARDGAQRMDQLILDLLAYSRIGRMGRHMGPVNLAEVAEIVVDSLRPSLDQAGADLTVAPNLPLVFGDADELARLLLSLIGNSLKYRHDERPAKIELGWQRVVPGTIELWVADNGIGIDPQFFDRIFLIFQRLHGRGQYDGTGIGLAICKKIVERHGGRIRVESVPGQGSRFILTLAESSVAR